MKEIILMRENRGQGWTATGKDGICWALSFRLNGVVQSWIDLKALTEDEALAEATAMGHVPTSIQK